MIQLLTSQKTLNLLFPQWQGSGTTKELYDGAMLIHKHLQAKAKAKFVRSLVTSNQTLKLEKNILGYSQILQQLSKTKEIIQDYNRDRIDAD